MVESDICCKPVNKGVDILSTFVYRLARAALFPPPTIPESHLVRIAKVTLGFAA